MLRIIDNGILESLNANIMRVELLARFYRHHGTSLRSGIPRPSLSVIRISHVLPPRHITYTNHPRQDEGARQHQARTQVQLRPEQRESIKPEFYQETKKARPDETPETDALLSEQTVTNKEQRKADWAIMKEMARYLWPKVGLMEVLDNSRRLKHM